MRKAVSVFLDIEDTINPLSDDAARDLLQLFSEEGVRGCMCITGEKCRALRTRGRDDIVDLMRSHSLGIHTNTHSRHPTTMELAADLDYEAGCSAILEAERGGVESFADLFGSTPSYWGGAAFTWTPEINFALKELGIPAYIYALTQTPKPGIHRFDGVVAFPHGAIVHEFQWANDTEAYEAGTKAIELIRNTGQPWASVLVGHPTKFRHKQYWDTPFFAGRTPEEPEFADPVPVETFERSRENLRIFLNRLKPEFDFVGIEDALAWPWQFRPPTPEEKQYFEEHTPERIRATAKWCVHYEGLDPENMVRKTMALEDTLEIGILPNRLD